VTDTDGDGLGTDSRWFDGKVESAFVGRVRQKAALALGGLVPSDVTWSLGDFGDGLLVVDVPDLPASEHPVMNSSIQVLWERGSLRGYWGCAHLFDDFDPADPEALLIQGLPLDGTAADLAVDWFVHELRRPLVLQTWTKDVQVAAQRWVLSDTDRVLGAKGSRWAMRGPPSAVTEVRPRT
jgi:hypothetical protein